VLIIPSSWGSQLGAYNAPPLIAAEHLGEDEGDDVVRASMTSSRVVAATLIASWRDAWVWLEVAVTTELQAQITAAWWRRGLRVFVNRERGAGAINSRSWLGVGVTVSGHGCASDGLRSSHVRAGPLLEVEED
jgi:hypothetical protein